tara:strand:+ start:400 stop:780 length:381 start_codon:yes stop_codon:yes gene_type:complete
MFLLNNVKVHQDIQRTIGDVQYPARWFSNAEARAKVGMIEVPDIPRPDDALFTSVENPDGSYTATPRTAEDLAERALADKLAANAIIIEKLEEADLKIVRAIIENDTVKIAAHRESQAALRAQLQQ